VKFGCEVDFLVRLVALVCCDIGDIGDICDIICDICDICDISLERRVNLGTEITHPATSPAAHFFLLFHFSELLIFIGEM